MSRQSAGIVLYRHRQGRLEILLVHPGGPYWARRDMGAWSIPKGEAAQGEDLLERARQEFAEELGSGVAGPFRALTPIRQAGGKIVHAWAAEGDLDADAIRSNNFTMEWPPRSGLQRQFPEVDRAAWFDLDAARAKILPSQRPILDQLAALMAKDAPAEQGS
jgi:predicted NUDIX family NTP pyrophosphohydrolase